MDNIGTLELAWSQGYNGGQVYYVDSDVLCYQCGRNIKMVAEDGVETVFAFKGRGIGPITVHKINKHIAIAEQCLNPKIYIYSYPTFREHVVIEDAAQLEYQKLVFSSSEYMAGLSGLPDFELILWNYEKGIKLSSVKVGSSLPTSFSFNPCNWREICLTTSDSITVWITEQSHDKYVMQPQNVRIPVADPNCVEDDEKDHDRAPTRASTRMTRYTVELPKTAVAGLVGDNTTYLEHIEDTTVRCSPVSQAWTPSGDIYIGCDGGQLIKVNDEVFKARVIYYPPQRAETPHSRASSAVEPSSRKTTLTDIQPVADDVGNLILQGCLTTLTLHRKGLYAAGEDGILRLIDIKGKEFRILEHCNIGEDVTSLSFSPNYTHLVLGTSTGSLHMYQPGVPDSLKLLKRSHFGDFVGIGCLAQASDCIISAREDGEIQGWSYDKGLLMSSLSVKTPVVSLSCSPILQI
ncbi:cilia- and flagella-associated protein 43 [Patella vulgata]|uniref:cilia- and flagella-associated protein 43 n=1 Tax=Patella vulgata TaxID=6465 RepID=UPI00217F72F0|nr:cilia- and flagella-associated protein 43 [Patella vulgata]